jgi:hypothetical protein
MDMISLNHNLFINGQSLCFFFLLCQQNVDVCFNWKVWVTHELLLLAVFPSFEIAYLNFIEVNSKRKVIDVVEWDLAVFPSLEILPISS